MSDMALFDLEDMGLRIQPTIAMRAGKQLVFQCAHCGLVAVQSSLAPGPLAACPACGRETWWKQQLPVAGIWEREEHEQIRFALERGKKLIQGRTQ